VVSISQVSALPDGVSELALAARKEGYRFVDRLIAEFEDGTNTFSQSGEALFEARMDDALVGVGGLNRDPYIDNPDVGRVRRLYVHPDFRREGVATLLMDAIELAAQHYFSELRLLTDTSGGASFYSRLGYAPVTNEKKVSHSKRMDTREKYPPTT